MLALLPRHHRHRTPIIILQGFMPTIPTTALISVRIRGVGAPGIVVGGIEAGGIQVGPPMDGDIAAGGGDITVSLSERNDATQKNSAVTE